MKKLYVLAISVFAAGLATAQVSLSSAAANQGNPELTSQSKVLIDKADNGGFGVAPKSNPPPPIGALVGAMPGVGVPGSGRTARGVRS